MTHAQAHTLRHSFATAMADDGVPTHEIQQLLGHADLKTTERYIHTRSVDAENFVSPLDRARAAEQRGVIRFPVSPTNATGKDEDAGAA